MVKNSSYDITLSGGGGCKSASYLNNSPVKHSPHFSGQNFKDFDKLNLANYYASAAYAFTLAEVLITIGVIGIVAAIAIPSLINHYNDKVLETRYQRSKNILINGYKLMMSKEQVFDMKDLSVMKCGQDIDCIINAHKEVFKMMRDSSSPDISEAFASDYTIPGEPEKQDFSSMASQMPTFQTTDGMSYMGMPQQDGSMILYADLNGKNKPNTAGEDFFIFSVSGNGVFTDMTSMAIPEPPPEELIDCINDSRKCLTEEQCMAAEKYVPGTPHGGPGGCYTWNWAGCVDYCR